jgi:hypothetical protein
MNVCVYVYGKCNTFSQIGLYYIGRQSQPIFMTKTQQDATPKSKIPSNSLGDEIYRRSRIILNMRQYCAMRLVGSAT